MKFRWLLLSTLSFLLVALPARAGRLIHWRFEPQQNRLTFTTDGNVQPRAELLSNPSRLVIDLPGTVLNYPTVERAVGGAIASIRIGQFDSRTTRIVIELVPGYTLDPSQVKFEGLAPTEWSVNLPTPQPLAGYTPSTATAPAVAPLPQRQPLGNGNEYFQVTATGFSP
ncbi:MAG: AMIN domain-containing protein, partial [Spirulinaceae cyanobacterium RM2_2_10]|nr:AMIN domain-containing protein [Spirulinaceae cyanobacterium RM2_2_10]